MKVIFYPEEFKIEATREIIKNKYFHQIIIE